LGKSSEVIAHVVGALMVVACGTDSTAPHLDSVMPGQGRANQVVTLVGERLCGMTGDCLHAASVVQFGIEPPMVDALVQTYAATSATIVVPSLAVGTTQIVVTVEGRTSNALAFEIQP